MDDKTKAVLKRAGRTAVSSGVGVIVAHLKSDPKWMILVPVISALGKFLRLLGLQFIPF